MSGTAEKSFIGPEPELSEQGLAARDLVKAYRGRRVVNQVSFHVNPGEIVGLLGPNGAGKSTSFNMVVGLVRPDGGEVSLSGQKITSMAMHQRARLGLGYLPQEQSVFQKLSVFDNLLAVLQLRSDLNSSAAKKRAQELLEEFELTHVLRSDGKDLSGGERRRLEIARCLAMEPTTVLLDEPFAGIDPIAVADIQQLVLKLQGRGLEVLITDHNVRETLGICTRAYILLSGKVLEHGTREQIAESDSARSAYLGQSFRL